MLPNIGLPWWLRWQRIHLQGGRPRFDSWVGKVPWRSAWQLQYSCLENPHEHRSQAGYGTWGRKESDMTEQLSFFSKFVLNIYYVLGIVFCLFVFKYVCIYLLGCAGSQS